MNHIVLHLGDGKESYFKEAFGEYQKRMRAFGCLEDISVKPYKTRGGELSESQIQTALENEAKDLEKILSEPRFAKSYKIALCIEGKEMSSTALSALYEKIQLSGKNTVVYLIGSSWGLHERIKGLCDLRLSFSPMTFAHSLFKVMLAEQIYRAEGISAGNQYHK